MIGSNFSCPMPNHEVKFIQESKEFEDTFPTILQDKGIQEETYKDTLNLLNEKIRNLEEPKVVKYWFLMLGVQISMVSIVTLIIIIRFNMKSKQWLGKKKKK